MRTAGRAAVNLMARLSTFLLTITGIITTSCNRTPQPYGVVPVPVVVEGTVESQGERIQDIQMMLHRADSSQVLDSTATLETGIYNLYAEGDLLNSPDTLLITARDIDGPLNGLFLPQDTLIEVHPDSDNPYYQVDFELLPDQSR